MSIFIYFKNHWVEWLFGLAFAFLGYEYKILYKRMKDEQAKNNAISDGVQALLRESIIDTYVKATEKGYVPIYVKDSIKRVYQSYSALSGNDVAHKLYEKLLMMPEKEEG